MQKCSICEKPIYGRSQSTQKLICGSCPLNKTQGGASGKSFFAIRFDLAKMVTKQIPEKQESVMSDLKVKSNVPNRTVLLDGRFALNFNAEGIGFVPAHLLPVLEREMRMKPNRFSIIVDENFESLVEPPAFAVEALPPVPNEVKNELVVPAEVPAELNQEFLMEESEKPVVKKASKKKVS